MFLLDSKKSDKYLFIHLSFNCFCFDPQIPRSKIKTTVFELNPRTSKIQSGSHRKVQ